jgi:hypothetical protein
MLASTKYSRQLNVGVNKILASTKCWRIRRSISLLSWHSRVPVADFSQTSLMFSQKVLIPPHAVAKCAVAAGCPALWADSLPHCTGLLYRPAMQKMSQILAPTKYRRLQDFTHFRQTIAVNISAHRRPTKNW